MEREGGREEVKGSVGREKEREKVLSTLEMTSWSLKATQKVTCLGIAYLASLLPHPRDLQGSERDHD